MNSLAPKVFPPTEHFLAENSPVGLFTNTEISLLLTDTLRFAGLALLLPRRVLVLLIVRA
jgi:hypothetical protein